MSSVRVLVVFDSSYGNTERIARAIGAALSTQRTADVHNVVGEPVPVPAFFDLLIVGGPTQRHRVSPALSAWLEGIGRRALSGVPAAAFDTRYRMSAFLSGSAAGIIARKLERAGCRLVARPESFFVERDRPPSGQKRRHAREQLEAGELERGAAWAVDLLRAVG
jgi:flavodoxin